LLPLLTLGGMGELRSVARSLSCCTVLRTHASACALLLSLVCVFVALVVVVVSVAPAQLLQGRDPLL